MGEQRQAPLGPQLIATWFGAGLLPWAPGTWGSLAALPFAWVIATLLGAKALFVATVLLFFIGWWAAARVGRASGIKDAGAIVVDEVAGQWLTLAVTPADAGAYAAGFLLFRLFDITKPWPARWIDQHVGGGLGVMLDDIVAALYAAAALALLLVILGKPID
jgi:phosphatidylglycerophosphatase A